MNMNQWLQYYASHIFQLYSQFQSSLGISDDYRRQIELDLKSFYHDPLKREFIENTYSTIGNYGLTDIN